MNDQKLVCQGDDYFLQQDFSVPIINILWQLVAGHRFDGEHAHGLKIVEGVNVVFEHGFISSFLPMWIQKVVNEYER